MGRALKLSILAALLAVALVAYAACGGSQMSGSGGFRSAEVVGSLETAPPGALAELDALECPEGVDSALWAELKGALADCLTTNNRKPTTRFASAPPTGEANQVNDLGFTDNGDGTYTFSWHYRNLGDYDQNGTVGISDITPIAVHFGETYDPETEPNSIQAVIDSSGNGKVGIEDITAIAVGFGANVHHYRIESAEIEAGPFTPVQDVNVDTGTAEGLMSFSVDLTLDGGLWMRVVPVDSGGQVGDFSDALQLPYLENQTPVAALSADPTTGEVPLDVEFDASGSSDVDGDIVLYEWDWENDGTWDEDSGSTPTSSHTYAAEGDYTAAVRVTDDGGLTDTASVEISVTGVQPNQPPVAVVTANPTSGDAPLTVGFDASDSDDIDGSIVLYEWDWESDGTWDEDSGSNPASSHEYADAGDYLAAVRVTDDEGATDTDDITITVTASSWVHTWGGSGNDYASAICVDGNGNAHMTGATISYGAGWDDLILLAYAPSGDLLWQKAWGGADSDWGAAIAVDASGNIYVAGGTYSFGAGLSDIALLKYSASGNLLWQKTWGGAGVEWATSMALDATGNIYVAGETYSFGAGGSDIVFLKYTPSGDLLWQKAWGGSGGESAAALAVDTSGDIYFAGTTALAGAGMFDVALLKLNPDGDILWKKAWGGSSGDFGYALALDASGDAYVAGETYNFGAQDSDMALLKFSSSGNLLWQRMWGGSTYDTARTVSIDASGDVYVAGDTESFGAGNYDIALLKYTSAGDLLDQRTWGKSRADQVSSARLVDGKLYFVGKSPNPIGGWWATAGTTRTPAAAATTPGGTNPVCTGAAAPASGVENILDGILDSGGGGTDALVYKLDLSLW